MISLDFLCAVDLLLLSHRRLVGVNLPLRKITQTYKCGKEISYKSPWLVSEQCRLSTFPIRDLSYNDKSTKPTVFFIHKRKYVSSFHFKTSFGEKNAEGRFENGLGSVTEMGVKGYPFIISRRLSARFD